MERNCGAQMEASHCSVSLTEGLVTTRRIEDSLAMDQLLILFPDMTWWQFFEVIDSLSPPGRIAIHPTDHRDDLVSLSPRHPHREGVLKTA